MGQRRTRGRAGPGRAGPATLAVLANMVGQALAYLSRGVAAGTERFRLYGGQLAAEGLLRVLAAAALFAAGVHTAAPFGFALALSTVVSVVVAGPATRTLLHQRGVKLTRFRGHLATAGVNTPVTVQQYAQLRPTGLKTFPAAAATHCRRGSDTSARRSFGRHPGDHGRRARRP